MSILNHIGSTPMVEIEFLSKQAGTPIFAKCEHMNPGGSIKDRIALAIVDEAETAGVLSPGMTLIEATAGNTGVGLALVAAVRGYKLVCVMPEKMSVDKRNALTALGAQVIVTKNAPPTSDENFQNVAIALAKEHGWYLTDQFNNPANVSVHYQQTGGEIIADIHGPIAAFISGAGTGGTISGVGRRLKEAYPDVQIVLADPVGSGLAGWVETGEMGPDGKYEVEGIGSSEVPGNLDGSVIDSAISVSDDEAFGMVQRLVRQEGLLVGGSSGANLAAALKYAIQNEPKGPVVSILCDGWDRYRTKPWMKNW